MELNGIKLFDAPHPELLTPVIKREIVNCIDIFHKKKLSVHHHADLVGHLSGYEFIELPETTEGYDGYCDYINKIIAMREGATEVVSSLFHEIGHSLQYKLGIFYNKNTLSDQVKIEHQAETIPYNLFSALVDKHVDNRLFKAYFNIENIKWLNEYYQGYFENDLF